MSEGNHEPKFKQGNQVMFFVGDEAKGGIVNYYEEIDGRYMYLVAGYKIPFAEDELSLMNI